MQEARKPRKRMATSRVTITVIAEKLLDFIDHRRHQMLFAESAAGKLARNRLKRHQTRRRLALELAHGPKSDRQRHRVAVEIGNIEAEGYARSLMDEPDLRDGASHCRGDHRRGLDRGGSMIDGLIRLIVTLRVGAIIVTTFPLDAVLASEQAICL